MDEPFAGKGFESRPEAERGRSKPLPLLLAVVGFACFAWLAWYGVRGYWTSQAHQHVGTGLLYLLVIAMALWSATASAAALWLWRASRGLSKRRLLALASLLAGVGLGPPIFASWWLLELVLWAASH